MTEKEPIIENSARLSVSKIATLLEVSTSSVNRYFKQGRLKSCGKLQNLATGEEIKRFWRTYERYYT